MRANGHSRPTSPATTPPPGGKSDKLKRVSRPPVALESKARGRAELSLAPVATVVPAAPVAPVASVAPVAPAAAMVPVPVMPPFSSAPGDCGGCSCGRVPAQFGWDSWLWYPWVQQMGQLWADRAAAGCPTAVFGGHSGVYPGSMCGAGGMCSAPLTSQPTASPAPLDLRVPPN